MNRVEMCLNTARTYATMAQVSRSMVYLGQARKALEMAKMEREKAQEPTNVIDMSQYITKQKKVA